MSNEFTCARCHRTFEKSWSDEDSIAEYERTMPNAVARDDDTVQICNNCYPEFIAWVRAEGLEP